MGYIQALKMLIELIPLVIQAMKSFESVMPPGSGQQKLEMVQATMKSAYDASTSMTATFETLWSMMAPVITATAKGFKVAGIFKASAPAALEAAK